MNIMVHVFNFQFYARQTIRTDLQWIAYPILNICDYFGYFKPLVNGLRDIG